MFSEAGGNREDNPFLFIIIGSEIASGRRPAFVQVAEAVSVKSRNLCF
jgi:hypothetical protein